MLCNTNHMLIYGISTEQKESYVDIWNQYCAIGIIC